MDRQIIITEVQPLGHINEAKQRRKRLIFGWVAARKTPPIVHSFILIASLLDFLRNRKRKVLYVYFIKKNSKLPTTQRTNEIIYLKNICTSEYDLSTVSACWDFYENLYISCFRWQATFPGRGEFVFKTSSGESVCTKMYISLKFLFKIQTRNSAAHMNAVVFTNRRQTKIIVGIRKS